MSNYEICQVCGGVHYGTCCPSGINKRKGQAMEKVSDEILHEIVKFSGDRIMPLIASELILARQQLEAMKWVPVGERLPEAKQSVLVIVKHRQRHIEKACYIPPKTVLAEDFLSDEFDCEDAEEYDEENDCYWVKEGWWEDSWEADNNWKMSGEVTHWMPLPVQPEEG